MPFTGILGTDDSRLGDIVLGLVPAPDIDYEIIVTGLYRVADDSAEGLWVFRGLDAEPDPEGSPIIPVQAMSADGIALPVDPDHENRFLVQARDRWGLRQQQSQRFVVPAATGGLPTLPDPSAPTFTAALASASPAERRILVTATYPLYADQTVNAAADQWAIYATPGVPPVPGVDTPTLVPIGTTLALASLGWLSGNLLAGQTYYVVVTVIRTADGAESTPGTPIEVTIPGGAAPAASSGDAFLGQTYLQTQP